MHNWQPVLTEQVSIWTPACVDYELRPGSVDLQDDPREINQWNLIEIGHRLNLDWHKRLTNEIV